MWCRLALALALFPAIGPAQALWPSPDPEIQRRIDEVSADRLEATVRRLVGFGTRHTQSSVDDPDRGIGAARRWLFAEFETIAASSQGRMVVTFDEHKVEASPRLRGGANVVNVVATLRGSDPERLVIVSGHYDSRASAANDARSDAPGADDDASGTAVTVEAARVLADLAPRATLVFLLTAAEEQGLLGAHGYARGVADRGLTVEAMITNDIVGGVEGTSGQREPMRVRIFSEGNPSGPKGPDGRVRGGVSGSDNDSVSRQLARYLAGRAPVYVPGFEATLIFRQDRYLRGGDHSAFNELGFPGVRFTEVHENYAHQHQDVRRDENGRVFGDLPELLDYGFVRRVAQVNAAGIAELALAPAAPRSVRVMTRSLTPHTELVWDASPETDLAGYAVLHRRTHEPTWTHRVVLGKDVTRHVLEGLSKDDHYFAVEAFDTAGRRSLPVYPIPQFR